MPKFLGQHKVKDAVSKLVEVGEHYVINGQFYKKSNFMPEPLKFASFLSTSNCEMSLNQIVFPNGKLVGKMQQGNMIDNRDSNITYVMTSGSNLRLSDSKSTVYIYKVDSNKDPSILGSYGLTSPSVNQYIFGSLLDQDEDHIYASIINEEYRSIIIKIRKSDMKSVSFYDAGVDKTMSVIKTTDTAIYLAISGEGNYFAIAKYNKVTGAATIMKDDTGKTGGYSSQCIIENDPSDANSFFAIRDDFMQSDLHRSVIKKYSIDTNSETVGSIDMSTDLTILTHGLNLPTINNHKYATNELLIIVGDNDEKFLACVRYGYGATHNNCSLWVFEFTDERNLKLIQEINFSPQKFTMLLATNENKSIILGTSGGATVYSWNKISKRYENTTVIAKNILVAGSDRDENVFIQSEDASVEIISAGTPSTIYANIEKEKYEYNGSDISANAIVYAESFEGELVSVPVKLVLSGPAKFSSTNSKIIEIRTTTLNLNILPITITGPGKIEILAQAL